MEDAHKSLWFEEIEGIDAPMSGQDWFVNSALFGFALVGLLT
ncbi:hypothetical protein [Clavibacter michiganensis]|jgi:hypothetical protein|nr:hypothetical protein [Clavibacter michiganensis]